MGTQTAIALDIVAGGADFVLALKGNQEKLSQAVVTHIDEQMQTDFADCGARRLVTAEQSHGRKEQRIVIQMPAPKTLPGFSRWSGLKTIDVVMLMPQRDGRETYASRCFISSLAMASEPPRPRRAQPLGYRKHLPLEPRYHLSRRWVPHPRSQTARELRMAQSLHPVIIKTTRRRAQARHATPTLQLERRRTPRSPQRTKDLVCAGPAVPPPKSVPRRYGITTLVRQPDYDPCDPRFPRYTPRPQRRTSFYPHQWFGYSISPSGGTGRRARLRA